MKHQDYRREVDQIIFSDTLEEDIIEHLRQYREQQCSSAEVQAEDRQRGANEQRDRRKKMAFYCLRPIAVVAVMILLAGAMFCQTSAGKVMMEKVQRTMMDIVEVMFREYENSSVGAVEQIGLKERVGGNSIQILEVGLMENQMVLHIKEEADGKDKLDILALYSSLSGKGISDWGEPYEWDKEQGSLYQCIENKETGEYILIKPLDEGISAEDLQGKELTYRMTLQTMAQFEGVEYEDVEVYNDISAKKETSFQVTFSGQLQESVVSINQSLSLEDGTSMLVKECGYNGIYAWVTYDTPHSLLKCMEDMQRRMDKYFEEHTDDCFGDDKAIQEIYQGYYYVPAIYDSQGDFIGEVWHVQNEKKVSGAAEKDLFALDSEVKEFILKPVKVEIKGNGQGIKTEQEVDGIPVRLDGN